MHRIRNRKVDDIRRRDLEVFATEAASIQRLAVVAIVALAAVLLVSSRIGVAFAVLGIVAIPIALAGHGWASWTASIERRFHSKHLAALWAGCEDRLKRFNDVLKKAKSTAVGDLQEMPRKIEEVSRAVYRALRKADIVAFEISKSESGLPPLPGPSQVASDAQSKELFQVADRNIAEYRIGMQAVMAGVQRSEAQAAVFMTTLDTLRMKVLGYRLVGQSPELPSHEFLAAIAEAKLQLESIDKALDELDLSVYPQMVAAVRTGPPPIPEDAVVRQKGE